MARVRVIYRGHRSRFGPVLFGDGATMPSDVAHAVAAELRGRGHAAEVETERPGPSPLPSDVLPGQLFLWSDR
jgi:hypothetical protein